MSNVNMWFDCFQCGEIGLVSELKEHPTRPIAMDIGFCPKCGCEIQELVTEQEISLTIEDYGENASEEIAKIKERAWG